MLNHTHAWCAYVWSPVYEGVWCGVGLFVRVCVCVCVCVCVHVRACMCAFVPVCVYMYVSMCDIIGREEGVVSFSSRSVSTTPGGCMCGRVDESLHGRTECLPLHTHACVHTHSHTRTHSHAHTHAHLICFFGIECRPHFLHCCLPLLLPLRCRTARRLRGSMRCVCVCVCVCVSAKGRYMGTVAYTHTFTHHWAQQCTCGRCTSACCSLAIFLRCKARLERGCWLTRVPAAAVAAATVAIVVITVAPSDPPPLLSSLHITELGGTSLPSSTSPSGRCPCPCCPPSG